MKNENKGRSGKSEDRVSDFHLERYALGELPPERMEAIRVRLVHDEDLQRRMKLLEAENLVFATRIDEAQMLHAIRERADAVVDELEPETLPGTLPEAVNPGGRGVSEMQPQRRPQPQKSRRPSSSVLNPWSTPNWAWLFPLSRSARAWQAAGVMALLLLAALPVLLLLRGGPGAGGMGDLGDISETEVTRVKGKEAELRIYRKTQAQATAPDRGEPEELKPGAIVEPGDVVQAQFHPGNFTHGAIASVDGNGMVTLHWPATPDAATALAEGPGIQVPQAFQLDDAPRFERFYLLLAMEPLALDELMPTLAQSAAHDENWLAGKIGKGGKSMNVIAFTLNKGQDGLGSSEK